MPTTCDRVDIPGLPAGVVILKEIHAMMVASGVFLVTSHKPLTYCYILYISLNENYHMIAAACG